MKWEEKLLAFLWEQARKISFHRNKYLQTETPEGNFICLFLFHEEIERYILRNISIILEILETIPEIILPGIILFESLVKFCPPVSMF